MTAPPHAEDPGTRSRPRTLHPTPDQWVRIKERARARGLTVSRFLVRCALDEGPAPEPPREDAERPGGAALALTEAEQRELHETAQRLERCARAVLGPRPDGGPSVIEALDFVTRWHRALDAERKWLRRVDGEHLA